MNLTARRGLRRTFAGFTLVELLVVIAIIAILAIIAYIFINPLEIMRSGRDSNRLADLSNLQLSIGIAVQEASSSGAFILCSQTGTYPCSGSSILDSRNTNGTGWVRVDFSTQQNVSVPTLPVDPTNNATVHYAYCADNDKWEINTVLESQKHIGKMSTDGGDDTTLYEVGTALGLVGVVSGCAY